MEDNPYKSPLTVDCLDMVEAVVVEEPRVPRPLSVAILSVFQILLGMSSLHEFVVHGGFGSIGQYPQLFTMLCHGLISTISGAGMWIGFRWSWWLMALHTTYLIVRDGVGMANLPQFMHRYGTAGLFNGSLLIAVQTALLIWLFRVRVLEYFRLKNANVGKLMIILIGLAMTAYAGATGLGVLMQ